MEPLHGLRAWIAWFGARRWRTEVLLAIVLTLAAAAFLASALVGGHEPQRVEAPVDDAPLATAHKPPQ
jgi:hypothetical protein